MIEFIDVLLKTNSLEQEITLNFSKKFQNIPSIFCINLNSNDALLYCSEVTKKSCKIIINNNKKNVNTHFRVDVFDDNYTNSIFKKIFRKIFGGKK